MRTRACLVPGLPSVFIPRVQVYSERNNPEAKYPARFLACSAQWRHVLRALEITSKRCGRPSSEFHRILVLIARKTEDGLTCPAHRDRRNETRYTSSLVGCLLCDMPDSQTIIALKKIIIIMFPALCTSIYGLNDSSRVSIPSC